jgi:hypothetical protein
MPEGALLIFLPLHRLEGRSCQRQLTLQMIPLSLQRIALRFQLEVFCLQRFELPTQVPTSGRRRAIDRLMGPMISVCNLPDYVALCRANLGAVTKNAERGTAFGIFKVSNQTKTELCVTRRFFGSGFFRFQSLRGMSEF